MLWILKHIVCLLQMDEFAQSSPSITVENGGHWKSQKTWNVKEALKGYINSVLTSCFGADSNNTIVCMFQCNLHIHGEHSHYSGVSPMLPLSHPSAVGLIIAHGNRSNIALAIVIITQCRSLQPLFSQAVSGNPFQLQSQMCTFPQMEATTGYVHWRDLATTAYWIQVAWLWLWRFAEIDRLML